MANVLGIGGVFFKCKDRTSLIDWYERHLGMRHNEHGGIEFPLQAAPKDGYCVWGPFSGDTEYFAPSNKEFMINLMVDDVAGVLKKVQAGGAEIVGEIEQHPYGEFGWFIDPEGNKIEIWKPATKGNQLLTANK